ncbi:hypothetical protein BSK59_28805 [Paenibacillus odorifer]|uniref:hypothetical protein n=1 Tax=Paenibacillus odorifer TaxID=189426 RepID=UPI000970214B|nr:hypothetical protein [Paenibacillus odorifer]OME46847.1 hypothetical protein BSK59_28805 [Paenibacillus odorifer]
MDKMLSIRPNWQIRSLFFEIQKYQEAANRTEIANWALEKAVEQKVDWRKVSKIKIEETEEEIKQPEFMQIRVDEEYYNKVVEQIMDTFKLKRLKAPYLIQLVLVNYLSIIINGDKDESIGTAEKMIDYGIDPLVFKNAYELSDDMNKDQLLELARQYLEEYDTELNRKIRTQMNQKIKLHSDYFDVDKYYPKPRNDFGTCNIRFVSKCLAGLLLVLVECGGGDYNTKEIILNMKKAMKLADERRVRL